MPQSVLLQARGLYTFPNTLSEVPQGALTVADNTVIDRNGVIEPRRGNMQYGTTFGISTDIASQLMTYKKTLLMQYNSTIQYDSDNAGTWLAFSGAFAQAQAGLRTKYAEANGNLYFTSSTGIQTISALNSSQFTTAANYIRPAGAAQALDLNGTVDYSTGGWFIYPTSSPGQSKVAYRMTWAFKDANGNLVEGVPSSRLVLTNYSTTSSATVNLTFQIPEIISSTDTQYFYTIYRTAVVQTSVGVDLAALDPGDEQYQVIQAFPSVAQLSANYTFTVTAANATAGATYTNNGHTFTVISTIVAGTTLIASGNGAPSVSGTLTKTSGTGDATITFSSVSTPRSITINDPTPESFRANGALLYTNPVSGFGILQSNYPPPLALDLSLFQQTLFFANTQTIQQLNVALLSTEALISGTSTITVTQGVTTNTYTFVGTPEVQRFLFDTKANTTDGGYFLLSSANNTRQYFVWFSKSGRPAITDVTFPAFAGITNGGYFLINSANNTNKYFVWFDSTGTTSTPTGSDTVGRIGVRIPITAGMTATDVANAVIAAGSGSTDFNLSTTGVAGVVRFTDLANGPTTLATAGIVPVGAGWSSTFFQTGVATTAAPSGADTIGRLGIEVDISGTTTAANVATAANNAINNVNDFTSIVDTSFDATGKTIKVTNADNGSCTASVSGIVPLGGAFAISLVSAGTGEDTSAHQVLLGNNVSPAVSIEETARSLVKVINANAASVIEAFYVSGPTDLPGLILLQANSLSAAAFHLTVNNAATGNEFSPSLPLSGPAVISTNTVELNAIYYSKYQQPESVPIVNKFNVGPKDKAILRILPIRTGLMIFKEDGIYQLTGTNGQFAINPFDSSAILLAPDSAQVLNNQVYMFSTQGVVTVSDTGVSVISRPIENSLQQVITSAYDFIPNTFGVAYEADRAYLLWTVTNTNDTVPTQCFRYNTFTTAWTRWPITKNCGTVLLNQNILYLGPTDKDFIEKERKNVNRTDYADREFEIQIPTNSIVSNLEIAISSTTNVVPGDVLVQTQYLTIYKFNQLLRMLDTDNGTGYKNYVSSFFQTPGSDLRSALNNLATHLDTDAGLAEANFFSSMGGGGNFIDFQTDFNILTALLNANVHTTHKNYQTSTGTIILDLIITSIIQNSNNVTIQYLLPFIQGPILVTKGILTDIVWSPQTFGDPSISKHVSEGTFLFDNNVFSTATVSYASDLMTSFEAISFPESGLGDWGSFVWDEQTWGGEGTSVPLRTYIPRNKQYCRFIRPRFMHNVSREKFSLFGTSLTFRLLTERAYRS